MKATRATRTPTTRTRRKARQTAESDLADDLALRMKQVLPQLDLVRDFLLKHETDGTVGAFRTGGAFRGAAQCVTNVRYAFTLMLDHAAAIAKAKKARGAR